MSRFLQLSKMSGILIIGGTRGLGASLVKQYASSDKEPVYGTVRSQQSPEGFPSNIKWLKGIDLMESAVGDTLAKTLEGSKPLSTVVSSRPSLMCWRILIPASYDLTTTPLPRQR